MERRRSKRIEALLDQEEQVLIEHDFQYVPSSIVNFSDGGALLALKEPDVRFTVGHRHALFFDSGGQVLALKATVRRKTERRVAFEFCDVTLEQTEAIHTKLVRMAMVMARVGSAG